MSSGMRTDKPSCASAVSAWIAVSPWMNEPIRSAFATVPMPGRPPSDHATRRITIATTTFAIPNESGVCFESPWLSTSHGDRPSFDSRMSTMPSAKRTSPKTRLATRAA